MLTSALHETAAVTQGISIEVGLLGFAAFIVVVLLMVRMKRSHDQKIRRAASAGFYDFDVARFGTASSSLMENAVASSARPLAPSFVAPGRAAGGKDAPVATPRRTATPAPTPAPAPMPVPSSFGVLDRSPAGPPAAFDQVAAVGRRPPSSPTGQGGPHLPIPATPYLAPPPPPSMSSLPPLVQPPPPSPRSEHPADDTTT
jgi:hypothetical protein